MLALSHELQYPVDEKCIILLLLLQQNQKCFELPRKGKSLRCILTINTSIGGLSSKRFCLHKFKNTFKMASTSINLYVFALNILILY